MRFPTRDMIAVLLFATSTAAQGSAQEAGGFIATLGTDTMQVERFARRGNRIEGTVVTRVPTVRVMRYTVTLGDNGSPQRYEMETFDGEGAPLGTNASKGSMVFTGDSIIRESLRDGALATTRMAAPNGAVPSPSIPYLGVSFLMYEIGFAQARRRAGGATGGELFLLTMMPAQAAPQRTPIWLVGADSAEMSYFGVAKSGYKFDAAGRLVRSDWTGTTYRYRIVRTPAFDVDAVARSWADADKRGAGMGPMSPRDTMRAAVGSAALLVDYSRPAKRGRSVWGDVVPWEKVWRLGADMATHFTTSVDLRIGDADVPAGTYTLWMLPSEKGESFLIISSQTRIFGTMYNPARDFARIPLRRDQVRQTVERLTFAVADGRLWIYWGDIGWSAAVKEKSGS